MPTLRREKCPHCGPIANWKPGITFHPDCFHVRVHAAGQYRGYELLGYISCKPPAHVFERDAQPTQTRTITHGPTVYEAVVMWETNNG